MCEAPAQRVAYARSRRRRRLGGRGAISPSSRSRSETTSTVSSLVEDEVLPEQSQVLATQLVPAAVIADEARVESVHLGRRDDLRGPTGGVRPDEVHHKRRLEHGPVVAGKIVVLPRTKIDAAQRPISSHRAA